jgi:lipopolysaccharide biosynthesis glycosyltransferase/predicted Zn-dependent protease
MTVAAFFRDAKVQGALSGGKPAQASGIIADFFAQFDYGDCSPVQLLALADLAMRGQDAKVARAALERVVASGVNLHLASYRLGRLDLAARKFAEAALHFQAGTAAHPGFPFNWMGLARALHAQGVKQEAAAAAERFVSFAVRPHAKEELAVLADLGDFLFDGQARARSRVLYEFLVSLGAERPRDVLRLAECLIAAGDHAAALRVLQTQDGKRKLDVWGRRALAFCQSHTGEHDEAIANAEAVALEDRANAGFVTTYLDVLTRAGDPARLRDALARHADLLGPAGVAELSARLLRDEGDIAATASLLLAQDFAYQSRLYYLSFETAYAALGAAHLDLSQALGEKLGALAPDDSYVKLLRIDTYFRQQLWEKAGKLLAAMSDEENARPHITLKRFEHACFIGDVEEAERLRLVLETMEHPNRQFMLPVFRFLAEQQKWDELLDRAIAWLDANLNYAQIGYVLFRAAKHTRRHAALLAAIEAIEDWAGHPDLVRLRATLLLDRADTLPAIERLAADPSIAGNEPFRRKLAVQRDVLANALARGGRQAIFLCSDRNYLCATIVALHNLTAVTNARETDFFLVVDDDIAAIARDFTAQFTADGLSVTVVPAAEVVDATEKLYPGYGLFTSGHKLAAAAYYRIYFAKYLQKLGVHDRALYVDGDILIRGRLEPLLVLDLAGAPMAARVETMRPEVRRAIALHQLKDNRYFNSGVLLFDLKSPALGAALDDAVAAILDDDTKLLFQDQCALNVGFRAGFADMERIWNYPVNEWTRLASVPAEATILHFLDRPKPWSAAYAGDAGLLWFERWRQTAAYIGEAKAVELFAQIQD